jgi:hypothetical protein
MPAANLPPLVLLVLVLLLAPAGCSWRATLWQLGLGSFTTELSVARVVQRDAYLETTLIGHGLSHTVYVPASEECKFVMASEEILDYVERGVAGRFSREDVECESVGRGEPFAKRKPRITTASPVPRKQATFATRYEDEEVILLRGNFPLAGLIGWPGGPDTIAVVPNDSRCRAALEGGVASMEYRASGRNTLSLVSNEGPCRIVGLIQPPDGSAGN